MDGYDLTQEELDDAEDSRVMQFEPHGAPAVVLNRGLDKGNGSEHPMSMTSHVNASTTAPENVGNKSAVRKYDPHKVTTIDANLSGYVGHGDDIPQVLFAEGPVQNVPQDVHAVSVHNQVALENGLGRPALSHSEAQGGTASTSSLAGLQTHVHSVHMQEFHVGSVAHAGLWLDAQTTQPDRSVTCAVLQLETQTRQPENYFFVAGPQNTSFDTPHNDMAKVMDGLAMPVEARQPDITAAANDATSCIGLDDMAKLKNGSVVAQIIRAQPDVTSPVAGLEDAAFDACHDDLTEPVDGLVAPLVEDKSRLKNTRSAVQSVALDTGMALPKDGSPTPAVPLVETQTRQPIITPAVAASQNAASDTELYNVTMPIDGSVTPAASSVEVQIRKPGIIPDVEGLQTAKSDDDTTLRIDGSVTSVAPLIETQTSQLEQPDITSPIQGLRNALETPVANMVLSKNGLFSVIAPLIEGKLPLVKNAGDIFSNNNQDHSLREVIPVNEISVQELQISGSFEHSCILTAHKDGQVNRPKQRSDDEGSRAVERKESEATLVKEIKAKEVEEESKVGALQCEATGTQMQALGEDDKQEHTDVMHKARDTIVGQEDTGDLIGRVITKRFGKKDFSGVAISYDTEHNWYKVVYEDGDQEDLEKVEIEALLLPLDYSSAVPSRKRQPPKGVVEERESKDRKKLKDSTLATEGKKRSKKALTEAHSPEYSGGRSSVNKDKEGKASMKPFLPENESKKLTGTKKGLVPLKGLKRFSTKVSKAGKKKTSENEIDDGGQSNFQERRRSGTGITLQEGIKRYLQKREDTGQSPTSKGVKRKVESEETKSAKHKLLKFGTTENPRSASMKSIGKTAGGCPREAVEPGATLVGSPTRKKFGGQYYGGNVISYDEDTKLYMIRYEDGDEEDLEWRDLKPTLASVRKQYPPVKLKQVKKSTSGSRGKVEDVQAGAALVGAPTRKKFGKKFYVGTVVSYDKTTQFYKVNYEDGDQEDLEWSELEPTLLEWWQGITHAELGDNMNSELEPSQVSERKQIILAKLKGSDAKSRREQGGAGIGDCLIGSSTWKKFGRKFYAGNVISYNKKTKLYKVTYEDGDQEDLEWSELEPTLVLDWQQGTTPAELGASKLVGDYRDSELEPSWVSERRQGSTAKLKGSNVKSRREQGDAGIGTFLIGSSTRKKFGRKFYTGNVINFDKKTKLYKVRYEDGDEEGLKWSELEPTLVSKGKLAIPLTGKLGEHQEGSTLLKERKQQDPLAKSNSVKGSKSKVRSDFKTGFELGAVAVGKSTRKKFSGRFYNGNVVSYNRRTKFYKVSYEDGDQEDLEWSQLEPTLVVKEKQDTLAKGFSSKSRGMTGLRQQ